jgi:hypothetical protein
MVGAAVEAMLGSGYAIVEFNLCSQAALGEELEGAVNGRIPDGGVVLLDQAVQFFGGKMVTRGKEDTQNRISLRAVLETEPG